jgi:hypothetical protein
VSGSLSEVIVVFRLLYFVWGAASGGGAVTEGGKGCAELEAVVTEGDQRDDDGEDEQAVGGNVLQQACYFDAAEIGTHGEAEQGEYPDGGLVGQTKGVGDGTTDDVAIGGDGGDNGE